MDLEFRLATEPWKVRRLDWKRAQDNEISKRIYLVLLRWIRFAIQQYEDWPVRDNCGHFFGGSFWYSADSAHTAVVFAILATLGEYDDKITGVSRQELKSMAIRAIRYMGFTHDTGPEDCVRVKGPLPHTSEKKWGGANDNFFMASQNGRPIACLAQAAWLLWNDIDDETKILVQNVVASYADRWSTEEPRNGVYFDTQCEENAWTSAGIGAAVAMFPEHPHHEQWKLGLDNWSLNAVTTYKDRLLEPQDLLELSERNRVKTVTFHPDFTTENHAFVHPSYMCAGTNLRALHIAMSLMGGEKPSPSALYNNELLYERTMKIWMQFDGLAIPVQGQDWWYNRHHERQLTHAVLSVFHRNRDAARLERNALSSIEALQQSNGNGCLLEEHGEECVINLAHAQFAKDLEHGSANDLATSYLLHVFGGEGAEPSDAIEMIDRLSGVYYYPYGSVIVHRTNHSFSSFSWRNHVMALTVPRKGLWTVTPLLQSFMGTVDMSGEQVGRLSNTTLTRDVVSSRIVPKTNGFVAMATLPRGNRKLLQNVAFVALPDGKSVYVEQFRVNEPCSVRSIQTGMIGIRNDGYKAMPELAPGRRVVQFENNTCTFHGFYGRQPNSVYRHPAVQFINVDGEIGYVLYGSHGITYINQHQYPKWKGVEDILILNDVGETSFPEPATLESFMVVTMPNQTANETKQFTRQIARLTCRETGTTIIRAGTYLVFVRFDPVMATVQGHASLDTTSMHLFEGTNRIQLGRYEWTGAVDTDTGGYICSDGELALENLDGVSLTVTVVADQMIFYNDSDSTTRCTLRRFGVGWENKHEHLILGPGEYRTLKRFK